MDENTVIEIENVRKKYRLGTIGGGTLRGELQSRLALLRGKADPNAMIGAERNYQKEFWALNGITFSVNRGERVGIIGHNGAGKSTLLKLLSRITAPTDGEMKIRGRITSMLEVGTGFHGELSGRENIYLNAAILGMKKEEVDAKIDDIIRFSECEEFIDTPVKRYSSGMYVKLAFSVAAHLNSEIMIMDEVLAVGDVNFQEKCLQKMREVSEDESRTILYVSHNMQTIRNLCDRCVVLEQGRVVFDGDVERAIQIYAGQLDGSKGESFYYGNRRKNEIARIVDAFLVIDEGKVEHETCVLENPSEVELHICINVYEKIEKNHFRFLVRYADDTSCAGTFFTETFACEKTNRCEYVYQLPISMLPEGDFYIQMVLSEARKDGTNKKISQIDRAVFFSIKRFRDSHAGLNWNRGWSVNLGMLSAKTAKGENEHGACAENTFY